MNRERPTPVTQVRLVAYPSGAPIDGTWALLDVGKPATAETVVASSAAGPVGSIVSL